MTKKININDSSVWESLDWDEPVVPEKLKKTDATINRSRSAFFKKGNSEFSETMRIVANNRDATYLENHKIGVTLNRDNTYQQESNSRPEVREKLSKSSTGKPKSIEHRKNLKATTTNKPGDKNWEEACKVGRNKRDKPFKCPFGVFNNRSEAGRYAREHKLFSNVDRKLEHWTKTNPEEYCFITHEEYDKIKNQCK